VNKNQSFSQASLSRYFYPQDFFNDPRLSNDIFRNKCLDTSLSIATSLFSGGISLDNIKIKQKSGYRVSNLAEKLILRKCAEHLKSALGLSTKHRDQICKELVIFLKEGSPYRIYRLDIQAFFETLDVLRIKSSLRNIEYLSTHTKNLLCSYLDLFKSSFGNGLPRGVEISPALADFSLKEFDENIQKNDEVFYYERFVDDIIIITSSNENQSDFLSDLSTKLLGRLQFNKSKEVIITVKKRTKI